MSTEGLSKSDADQAVISRADEQEIEGESNLLKVFLERITVMVFGAVLVAYTPSV